MQEEFHSEGVETGELFADPDFNTVVVFAFIDERGERYLWGWPRMKQAHREIALDRVNITEIEQAAWVHSTGMLLVHESSGRRAVLALLQKAMSAGVPTSLDLNLRVNAGYLDPGYRDVAIKAIKSCSLVFGSGTEEFRYLRSSQDWLETARSFVSEKRSVVVRLGAEGSMLLSIDGEACVPAYHVNVVDTVGAGDVYNAGFIAARLRGLSGEDSLRWGNAVAAYKIMRTGARGCPRLDELQAFLSQNSIEKTLD